MEGEGELLNLQAEDMGVLRLSSVSSLIMVTFLLTFAIYFDKDKTRPSEGVDGGAKAPLWPNHRGTG